MTQVETRPNASLGWGSCEFDGTTVPLLYWGARTILHRRKEEQVKDGYERYTKGPRKGEVKREWKGGPPLIKWKETIEQAWLEFLPDRQGWSGTLYNELSSKEGFDFEDQFRHMPDVEAFVEWLEHVVKPKLEAWLQGQSPSSDDRLIMDEGKFHYRASCRASYGYCYIAAWRDA
jgi:hypothetical protein